MAGVLTLYTAAGCARPVAEPSPAPTASAAALQSAPQATAPIGSHLEKFEQGPVEPQDADGDGISDLTYETAAYEEGGVSLTYPVLDMRGDDGEELLNRRILSDLLETAEQWDLEEERASFTLALESIGYYNGGLFTICRGSYENPAAAHPGALLVTANYDYLSGERMEPSEICGLEELAFCLPRLADSNRLSQHDLFELQRKRLLETETEEICAKLEGLGYTPGRGWATDGELPGCGI